MSWSRYRLGPSGRAPRLRAESRGLRAAAGHAPESAGGTASEVVGFRLHLPSRIIWHNSRDLETNEPRDAARGNILAWEQHLADRLDGAPLDIKVEMDSQSILHRTLWLFGGAFTAAVAVLAFLIWFTMRKGLGRRGYDGTGP